MKKQLFFLLACCIATFTYAQNVAVKGKVTDVSGGPLSGAAVKVKGSPGGTSTGNDGEFTLSVPTGATLTISYVGFETKEVQVTNSSPLNVSLVEDGNSLGEVIVVGYGTQKKATLTGSVSSVSNAEIVTTKNQNLENMLTGKVPGLRVVQGTSEPGTFNNQFDIRGFGNPLIIIDGVPRSNAPRLDPNEIESVSVLKDAAAAVYGVRAANGVVLITTKKGSGKPKIEYSFYQGFQNPSGLPEPVGAVDYFTLMNEMSMHNVNSPVLSFDDAITQPYRDGTKQSTDWYGRVLRNNVPQSQHNLSASGSAANKIDYYLNFGYSQQDGFWKTGDLNYNKYNLRSNLNAQITDRLRASLKLNGIIDQQNRPNQDSWIIFKNLWRSRPIDPYYANDNAKYFFHNVADFNPGTIVDSDISGFRRAANKIFQSSFSLDYDVPFITGLVARGLVSYDATLTDNTQFQKKFYTYDYNGSTDIYTPTTYQGTQFISRSYGSSPSTLIQFSLNYKKSFAEKHNIGVLALFEQTRGTGDNFAAQRQLSVPLPYLFAGDAINQVASANPNGYNEYVTKGLVGRVNYDYKSKYLAEVSFRYDGSSRFLERWGLFPAALVGWRVSEENFMKNSSALSFINDLKLRASYGVMGDDNLALPFQFLGGYDYPASGGNPQALASGYLFDSWTNSYGIRPVPVLDITWYESKTLNLGLDASLWKGALGITFDAFQRTREGLLAPRTSSVSGSFGAQFAQENLDSDQTQGMELTLTHRNKINNFNYSLGGNIALTRTKRLHATRGVEGNSYLNWRNNTNDRYNDIWFGWGYTGQYQSVNEIKTYPVYTSRNLLPGDYIYEDWNSDGVVDDMDRYPIATTINPSSTATAGGDARKNYPLLTFGFNVAADYKGFDLNVLMQGGAMAYNAYGEMYQSIVGNALDFFMDRWHPANPKQDPYDPSVTWISGHNAYTGTQYDLNSKRGIQNTSYLRVKSVELGYSFSKKLINKLGIQNLRLFTNGYNLFTFTNAIGVDPEHPAETYSYLYPLNKTINFGATVTF